MGEYTDLHHHHQEEEEEETEVEVEEEALSLCDLPLEDDTKKMMSTNCRRSNSEPHEFFEFFSDLTSSMCSAEDIIFCGKLVPLNKEVSSPIQTLIPHSEQDKRRSSFCRRSESVPGLRSSVSRSNSISTTKLMMRSSRSLNYRKLEPCSTGVSYHPPLYIKSWSVFFTPATSCHCQTPPGTRLSIERDNYQLLMGEVCKTTSLRPH